MSPEEERLSVDDLREAWRLLSPADRSAGLALLPRADAEDVFLTVDTRDQLDFLRLLPLADRRGWMRSLPPDDAADLVQAAGTSEREGFLDLLDLPTRQEVQALLAYAEDAAGGLMSPRYARVRPDMSIDEAFSYLRKQARLEVETIYTAYVLDPEQHLLGVVSFRDLFRASPEKRVREIMATHPVRATDRTDQESLARLFAEHDLNVIPVVDGDNRMVGIVTVDDIVDVVEEEATEDIQKMGGSEALDEPYLRISMRRMIKKRAGWLLVLFLGEMLTATAMGYFEAEIARAVVLALFMPLIISSGGNSGSQATTLVIRAMALGEVRLVDWWRVVRREAVAGLCLGLILATVGFVRIVLWPHRTTIYGEHYVLVALSVSVSLVGVVLWGTLAGSMLPFVLRRFGFDPASASAPFVATLVDVSGLVIYFTAASVILGGTLL